MSCNLSLCHPSCHLNYVCHSPCTVQPMSYYKRGPMCARVQICMLLTIPWELKLVSNCASAQPPVASECSQLHHSVQSLHDLHRLRPSMCKSCRDLQTAEMAGRLCTDAHQQVMTEYHQLMQVQAKDYLSRHELLLQKVG